MGKFSVGGALGFNEPCPYPLVAVALVLKKNASFFCKPVGNGGQIDEINGSLFCRSIGHTFHDPVECFLNVVGIGSELCQETGVEILYLYNGVVYEIYIAQRKVNIRGRGELGVKTRCEQFLPSGAYKDKDDREHKYRRYCDTYHKQYPYRHIFVRCCNSGNAYPVTEYRNYVRRISVAAEG